MQFGKIWSVALTPELFHRLVCLSGHVTVASEEACEGCEMQPWRWMAAAVEYEDHGIPLWAILP